MATHHTIITGDARTMHELPDRSVHLVVTSPPYWQLKDYGDERQIGFHDTYEAYVNNLGLVWKECIRLLHDGCRLCVNVGDQFARSAYYGRYRVIPIRTEIIKCCEALGMDYMGAIIWQKVTTTNTTGGAAVMGSFPFPRNGILKIDYEFILIFRKPGKAPGVARDIKQASRLTTEEWNRYFSGHWNFPGERQQVHLATFPEELPRRLIRMFSFVGDTVLDPFLGSGTTVLAARNLQRDSVGYEVDAGCIPAIRTKLGIGGKRSVPLDAVYTFVSQRPAFHDMAAAVRALPYVYREAHAFNRRIDPHQRTYGSRIGRTAGTDEPTSYLVAEVLTPELLRLRNGSTVRLLGIRENPVMRERAVEFLRAKIDRQRIVLKCDDSAPVEDGVIPAYVYLKNRTFVNAHLIKSGLVGVDMQREYRLRGKLQRLLQSASA